MGQRGSTMASADIAHLQSSTKFSLNELESLSLRFERLDRDHSGTLSIEELLGIPELAMNPLVPRILQMLHVDHEDEQINFVQFVQFLSVFHPKTNSTEKAKFAFQIYDLDGNGQITPRGLLEIVRMMAGRRLNNAELVAIVERTFFQVDTKRDGVIDYEEFCADINNHHSDTTQSMFSSLMTLDFYA